jgi:hypothetical protein
MEIVYLNSSPKKKDGGKGRFCEKHWPEYMNDDPHGVFILFLVDDNLLKNKRFLDYTIDNKSINKAYERFSPVCCYLGNKIMDYIYKKAAEIHHTQTQYD